MDKWLQQNLIEITEDEFKQLQLEIKIELNQNDYFKYFPARSTDFGEQLEFDNTTRPSTRHRLTFRTKIRENLINYIDIEFHIKNNGKFEAEIWFVHQSSFMNKLIEIEECIKQHTKCTPHRDSRFKYVFKMSNTFISNFCQIIIKELKETMDMIQYEEMFNVLKYDLNQNEVFDILPLQPSEICEQIEPKYKRIVIRFQSSNFLKINAITLQKKYNKIFPRIYFHTKQISELQQLSEKFKNLGLHKISGSYFGFVEEYNADFIVNFKQVLLENGYNSELHEEFMNPNANFESFFDELPDNLEDTLTLTRLTDQELYHLAAKYGIKESLQEDFIIFYDKLWNLYLKKADIDFCSDTALLTWENIIFLISHTQNIEKLEITSKFYNSQIVASAEIFINWLHGSNFVHIAANPQQGKTGTVESLINLIAFHFHRFFWVPSWCNFSGQETKICLYTTGVPYKQLNDQLKQISKSFAKVKYMGQEIEMPSKINYTKKYELHNLINSINDYKEFIYLVLDEDHYGQARNSMVDRDLLQHSVVDYLSEEHLDKKLLSLSATGYATISTIIENKNINGAVVTLPENYHYKGPKFALQHLTDINEVFENGETEESLIIDRISTAVDSRRYGLYIFRTPRQVDKYEEILNQHFGELVDVEIKPYNQSNNTTLKTLQDYDDKQLNKVFVILIDRLFSLGTDVGTRLKEHIRLIYDKSNNNIAQVMQSIGRAFGYHNNNDIEFICNRLAIEAHILINNTAGDILNNPFFVNEFNQAGFKLETNFSKKTSTENVTIATGLSAKVFNNDDIIQNQHADFINQFSNTEYITHFLSQSLIENIVPRNTDDDTWIVTRRASRTNTDVTHWENYYKKFVDDTETRIVNNPTFLHHIFKRNNAIEHQRRHYFLENIDKGIIAIFIDKNPLFSDDYNQNYAGKVILIKSTNNEIIEREEFTEFTVDNKKGELWNN